MSKNNSNNHHSLRIRILMQRSWSYPYDHSPLANTLDIPGQRCKENGLNPILYLSVSPFS
jgi:hypothetical protein